MDVWPSREGASLVKRDHDGRNDSLGDKAVLSFQVGNFVLSENGICCHPDLGGAIQGHHQLLFEHDMENNDWSSYCYISSGTSFDCLAEGEAGLSSHLFFFLILFLIVCLNKFWFSMNLENECTCHYFVTSILLANVSDHDFSSMITTSKKLACHLLVLGLVSHCTE